MVMETWKEFKSLRMMWIQPMIIWISLSVNIYGSILMPLMKRTMKDSHHSEGWNTNKKEAMAKDKCHMVNNLSK